LGFNPGRPTSTGRIDIVSPDPAQPPRIQPNYLGTAADVAAVLAGARLIGRLQQTPALRGLTLGPLAVGSAALTDEALLADFRARSGTVYHPCGSCRRAPEGQGGVVDASLRVYGVHGLRVVDASVFPNITSANTQAPTVMLAWKVTELVLAGR